MQHKYAITYTKGDDGVESRQVSLLFKALSDEVRVSIIR